MLIALAAAAIAAISMELWAALLHGRIWHHALWPVHRSHHVPRIGRFEANDALSALHAPIAMALIMGGSRVSGPWGDAAMGFGLGMTAFGVGYLVVHDGLVHGRLPVGWLAKIPYFRRVRNAHRVHHQRGGAPFGLFLGPLELARAIRRERRRARGGAPSAPLASDRAPRAPRGRPQGA